MKTGPKKPYVKELKNIVFYTIFFMLFSSYAFAQNGKLKGTVRDSVGNPVKDASVLIQNTKYITTTGTNGDYSIKDVAPGNYSVLVSLVGYTPLSANIIVKASETTKQDFKLNQVVKQLKEVQVIKSISVHGMGNMPEIYGGVIYSGQKTEVLALDSMDANTSQDNPREVLGRIPGSNYSETEGGGFPSNGIAFRGLRPTQSIEVQTRQNGYNITADLYGYNETYYTPPLETVERIEVVRGASSLQFGPQFGGLINFVIKKPPTDKAFDFGVSETGGSYGFASSLCTFGGTYKKLSYYSFVDYKGEQGWRPNSDYRDVTGFAKVEYQANSKFRVGLEYTLFRNRIHMSGGLTDAEFEQDPDKSYRSRNWLASPWNILVFTADYQVSDKTLFTFKSVLNSSARNLVWKNEDGGPFQADSISPGLNSYVPREVEHEGFLSSTNELRFLTNYTIGKTNQTLAAGVRYFGGNLQRQGGGPGSTGTDFDMNLYGGTWAYSLNFGTTNVAPFIENTFHIGNCISITPGFRYEFIASDASGYITDDTSQAIVNVTEKRLWYVPLAGLGLQIRTGSTTNIYANVSQAYEPITYDNLTPLGATGVVNPNMKDVSGYNAEAGWRGNIKRFLNFDIGVFYIAFNDEQGIELRYDLLGNPYTYTTNIGNAVHEGVEAYIECNPFKLLKNKSKVGELSFFNSYCYDQSTYVSGEYKGKYEEMAPVNIDRLGIIYSYKGFSATWIFSSTSKSYADAANTEYSPDAEVGVIPAYNLMDVSAAFRLKKYEIKAGVSNLTNQKYFNLRTNEYPGPGIIPAPARSIYAGFSMGL